MLLETQGRDGSFQRCSFKFSALHKQGAEFEGSNFQNSREPILIQRTQDNLLISCFKHCKSVSSSKKILAF